MDVKVIIEATVAISEAELTALKAATPENKLATARLLGGTVKSTVKVVQAPKNATQRLTKPSGKGG